ncbi:MAG: GTP-binding protein [Lachnospiraceae bacterium]|jgi:small GTP-binding protein|nr:GTP-binding protein [Lachnospiraceae bacterium]
MSETKEPESTPNNKRLQTGNIDNYNYEILSEDYTSFDMSFKLIVIGDSGVGKSCLTNNAIKNTFDDAYNATVGFEFFTFNIRLNGKVVKLQIWDTCGQELYRSLITNFYRNSSLAMMVYSINSKESFDNVEMWLRELRTHSNPDVKVFLIGNKSDLEAEREVTTEQGENFYKQNNLSLFMESSAKTGFNTQKIFIKAAEILYEDYNKYKDDNSSNDMGSTDENNVNNRQKLDIHNNKNKKGCCK